MISSLTGYARQLTFRGKCTICSSALINDGAVFYVNGASICD